MKYRLRVTAQARTDLKQIRSYVANQNADTAKALIAQISNTIDQLCDMPLIGRQRDELEEGLRSLVIGRYLVFYRLAGSTVEIVRVLHGARDIESLFG